MLNLEPVGVSLYWLFPGLELFFCVTCRHAVCFAFFTLHKEGIVSNKRNFYGKQNA